MNDYLAQRDAEWNRGVFERLGVTVAFIENNDAVRPAQGRLRRRRHLRHELRVRLRLPARQHGDQRSRASCSAATRYAIVDEVDSILVDEARTPLIISGEPTTAAQAPTTTSRASSRRSNGAQSKGTKLEDERLAQEYDYLYDEKHKTISPTESGIEKVERALRVENLYSPENVQLVNHLIQALKARGAVQARRRLRRPGRRGEDRRRVHRPHHGRAPLERGPAPGGRGEGGRRDPGGAPDARHDHPAELLPPLREARRHDRHREDRGEGVRRDLRPERRRDPDERRRRPRRQERPDLQDGRGEVQRRRRRTSRSATRRASRCSSARSPSRPPST